MKLIFVIATIFSLNLFAQITCPDTAPYPSIKEVTPAAIGANYVCNVNNHQEKVNQYLLSKCRSCSGVRPGGSETFSAHYSLKKKNGNQIVHEEWQTDTFECKDNGSKRFCTKFAATKDCSSPDICTYTDGRCISWGSTPASCEPSKPSLGEPLLLKSEEQKLELSM